MKIKMVKDSDNIIEKQELGVSSFVDYKTLESVNKKLEEEENTHILDINNFPDLLDIKKYYKIFLKEYEDFVDNISGTSLHENSVINHAKNIDVNKKWNSVILKLFGKDTMHYRYFPKTKKILEKNNKIISVIISIMKPGAKILPHTGVYRGILRYHLGLKVPKERKKCYIIINEEKYSWNSGEDIIFDDMYQHEVTNDSREDRIVLFLDIMKDFKDPGLNSSNKDFLYNVIDSETLGFYINTINSNFVTSIVKKLIGNNSPVYVSKDTNKEERLYLLKNYMDKIMKSEKITMATSQDIMILFDTINIISNTNIEGDFVEVGCWRGGTCLIAKLFFEFFNNRRTFHLIDTFEYFPDSINDNKRNMEEIKKIYKGNYYSIEKIENNFKKYMLDEGVNFIKHDVSKKEFKNNIDKISILRIDCDTYDAVYSSLEKMFYFVVKGGFIIIDDYTSDAVKCNLAVNNFIKKENLELQKDIIGSSLVIKIM